MLAWSEPRDLKSWAMRALSFRSAVLLLAASTLLFSEVRFSWVEMMVGRYLAVTNSHRPESGNVWEQGRLKQVATQTLEQMVTQQLTAQREAQQATSLIELIDGLEPSRGIMISAVQFRNLYGKIPQAVARTLFSPILMLRISSEKSWERVYLERENGQVGIYLLDRGNNVLSYTTLNNRQVQSTGIQAESLTGALDNQPEFAGRIYPADRHHGSVGSVVRRPGRRGSGVPSAVHPAVRQPQGLGSVRRGRLSGSPEPRLPGRGAPQRTGRRRLGRSAGQRDGRRLGCVRLHLRAHRRPGSVRPADGRR